MIGQRRRVTPIKRVEELVCEGEHQFRQLTETLPGNLSGLAPPRAIAII